jgi:hypothetical protein
MVIFVFKELDLGPFSLLERVSGLLVNLDIHFFDSGGGFSLSKVKGPKWLEGVNSLIKIL